MQHVDEARFSDIRITVEYYVAVLLTDLQKSALILFLYNRGTGYLKVQYCSKIERRRYSRPL